jgi:2-oxoglutarate dehydrogenase E2 component (dihydrolipoamide succinyltransferase)
MEDTGKEVTPIRFYSPLVKSIAKKENIPLAELETVPGTGKDGRLTRDDLLEYLHARTQKPSGPPPPVPSAPAMPQAVEAPKVLASPGDEIVEMDRMRRLIADHMVMSKQVSPHVTSFIEVDMTRIVLWRERIKDEFYAKNKVKLTFTPIFIEAAARALKDFPGVNASVNGYQIVLRKNINIGMATALPNGNLIVPVIRNADQKNLLGLAASVNSLAQKARENKLDPDDIQAGTFTVTNLGSFGSLTGSPIISQPQVAILGLGAIKKKPAVIETDEGDTIAIRHICILSLSYDHRVVDGALGGMYLQRIGEYLENFDTSRTL